MSKSTKIIAALGVVAGLGVAALPAFTYAAPAVVSGEVQVEVEVPSAIAMTIVGNNDEDPNTEGGVSVFTPDGSYDIAGYDTTAEGATLYDSVNLEKSGSKTTILPNSASDDATFKSTIDVYTNGGGYNLTLIDADSENSLVNTSDSNATIPAGTTISAGTPAWGYRVAVSEGNPNAWAAVPVSTGTAANIRTSSNNHDQTVVEYGVSTSATQKTGTYTDVIVYTATANN